LRLLLLADIHGRTTSLRQTLMRVRDIEGVLVAGDITSYTGTHWDEVINLLSEWCEDNGCTAYVVPGNADPKTIMRVKKEKVKILHIALEPFPPYVIGGIGGGLGFPFMDIPRLNDVELTLYVKRFISSYGPGLAPYSWILLTHTPPYGTRLDILYTGEHVGSHGIRSLIEEKKPLLAVSGHIHESRGIECLGKTVMVNPGPNYRGYFAVAEIEVSSGNVDVTLMKNSP